MLLRSRRVILPDGERPAALRIAGGRIADVLDYGITSLPTEDVVDVGGCVLMPGLVDSHVHINEPGRTEWEGLATASRAALVGGVTTLVDMPLNCSPATTCLAALEAKREHFFGRSAINVQFWAGVVRGNSGEIAAMLDAGALGAKCFLTPSGIDDFPHSEVEDLRRAMPELARRGKPLLVHAELDVPRSSPGNRRSHAEWVVSRPPECEVRAVRLMIDLCREFGTHVHIVHVAAEEVLPLIRAARAEGLPISAETCPHYLLLASEEVPDGATEFKCAPPIREAWHREALWSALRDGTLDMIVSDHSPCLPSMKERDSGDFFSAWGGIASLQFGLPLIWNEASRRGLSLADVVRWMALAPARLAGLEGHKGALVAGADADVVALDPDSTWSIREDLIEHRHKLTPYLGRHARGEVCRVWIAGREVGRGAVCPR